MSTWYKPKTSELSIDHKEMEVDIYVCQNNFGSIYVTLTFDQIKELASKLEAHASLLRRYDPVL